MKISYIRAKQETMKFFYTYDNTSLNLTSSHAHFSARVPTDQNQKTSSIVNSSPVIVTCISIQHVDANIFELSKETQLNQDTLTTTEYYSYMINS